MADTWLRRLIHAAIESFPIDENRKRRILKRIIERETED